jgi:ubiquinone/menaquinone biosynthesis C-methylase UbiE
MDPVMASYDRLANVYDRHWRSYEDATLHATLEAISCRPAERLLDVACGTGELERMVLERCPAF